MDINYDLIKKIKGNLNQTEHETKSAYATKSDEGLRRSLDPKAATEYRPHFSVDADRILHSLAYTRYIDKTQVFYLISNDHITHRVLHVQLVSKIGRTIGRFLGLNMDLIEAIALGHDIGHTPFGHDGEHFLSDLCEGHGIGHFLHNVQSVQFLDRVERKGKGWNLCLQTLDGILCHDGEVHNISLEPDRGKTFAALDDEMVQKKNNSGVQLTPMTFEGCVARMADTISYVGRDIEDAIRLGVITRDDLPEESTDVLGTTNGTIVYTLVSDVIANSYGKAHVSFSPEVSDALKKLKGFNLKNIYLNDAIKTQTGRIKELFGYLFEKFLADLEKGNQDSVIFTGFLRDMSDDYVNTYKNEEIVRDFIAGMTDQYFIRQCPEDMRPIFEDAGT